MVIRIRECAIWEIVSASSIVLEHRVMFCKCNKRDKQAFKGYMRTAYVQELLSTYCQVLLNKLLMYDVSSILEIVNNERMAFSMVFILVNNLMSVNYM